MRKLSAGSDMWKNFLLAVIALMLIESFLAMHFGRYRK